MTRKSWLLPLVLVSLSLFSLRAYSATVKAGSCSQTDVQNAINSSGNGDTVLLPGGNCTWSSAVTIPNSKGITVDGGGTTITGQLSLNANATTGSRITGFTFTSEIAVSTSGSKTSATFRVDHNTFNHGDVMLKTTGNAPGLIDHNTFTSSSAPNEMIHNEAMGAGDTSGWSDPVTPGGADMLYIEDNTFTFNATGDPAYFWGSSALQSYYGARNVFRHNTLNMVQVDQHGTAGNVGARWWEIYENTFNVVPNGNQSDYIHIRAGSGVIFNNHKAGATNDGAGSIRLEEEDSGYPALYQVGRGINQELSPAYVWGNDASMNVGSGSSNVVQGRDFMVLSAQPSTLLREESSQRHCSHNFHL